jgi:hypothetical protein
LFGNKFNFSLINVVKSKNISRITVCEICKRALSPVAETWFINKSAEKNTNDLGKEDIKENFQTNARK